MASGSAARALVIFLLTGACGGQGYILGTSVAGVGSAGGAAPSTQSAPAGTDTGTTAPTTAPATATPAASGGSASTSTPAVCTTTADTFANFADAALQASCDSCHAGEWDTALEATAKVASLRGQISTGLMPPSGDLDPTVKARLLTWLNCPTPLP